MGKVVKFDPFLRLYLIKYILFLKLKKFDISGKI